MSRTICSFKVAPLNSHISPIFFLCLLDDVEFEVSSDRRTGKPIAVKLLKIKPEVLPEERISGQVGPDLHAYPFTVLHGYIHPVKEHHFIFVLLLSVSFAQMANREFFCFTFILKAKLIRACVFLLDLMNVRRRRDDLDFCFFYWRK